jgi:MFS family permease
MPHSPATPPEVERHTPPRRALAPFRHGVFTAIWLGTLISNLGVWVQQVGAAWLMTLIAASPDWVAAVQSASSLPILLFALVGGVLADRIDRRLAQVIGQAIVMAAALALAVTDLLWEISPLLLLAMTFLLGVGSAIRQPAFQASVGDLVPREEVPAAVALTGVNFNIARALGPGIGGLIVAAAGPPVAFLVNAACNLVTIVVLLMWRGQIAPPVRRAESVLGVLTAGALEVAKTPALRRVMLRVSAFCLFASALWALLPVVTKDDLGGSSSTYGVLLGCLGLGAVLGAGVLARLRRRFSDEVVIELGSLLFALATVALATLHVLALLVPLLMLGGVAWLISMSTFSTTVQLGAPAWVRARVVAIFFMAMFGNLAFGSWLWGWVAAHGGVHLSLLLAGALLAVSLALRWRFPMPGHQHLA